MYPLEPDLMSCTIPVWSYSPIPSSEKTRNNPANTTTAMPNVTYLLIGITDHDVKMNERIKDGGCGHSCKPPHPSISTGTRERVYALFFHLPDHCPRR